MIPCCLVWDGVKLELELELELAGLGCSDFKEEKGIINKFMEHYIPQIKNNSFAQKYFALEKQPDTAQEK